jgi:hypothetical protein
MESPPEGGVSPRADFLGALFWMALGGAIALAAWHMDRLAHLHINQYEIPGLVPGLLGAGLLLLGMLLAVRAVARGALATGPAAEAPRKAARGGWVRMALILASMLFYALVLVGRGLPFWLSTAAFVAAFIFVFDRERQNGLGRSTTGQALLALACGAVASALITVVFQELFYVRLP